MIFVALSAVKEVLFAISHRADRISTAIHQYLLGCVDVQSWSFVSFVCRKAIGKEESALNVSKAKKKKSVLPKTLPGRLCSSELFREGISMIFMPARASGLRQDVRTRFLPNPNPRFEETRGLPWFCLQNERQAKATGEQTTH